MGRFLEAEKPRQAAFKTTSMYFTPAACRDGVYAGRSRPFSLPVDHAEENLYLEIREPALEYFTRFDIKWHDGQKPNGDGRGRPSNHLCDSQVCCVNFLFPFADKPRAVAELLRPVFPDIHEVLPMELPGQYISCEWIGERNYLNEKVSRNGQRTRGANFTSADAAVMFDCLDGTRQIVLIEWKYTESYSSIDKRTAASGTDRTAIYRRLYEAADFPLRKDLMLGFDSVFYEPFYQFLRQQLLANEMEKARELGADRVSLLHIAPRHNTDFPRVTAPRLAYLGSTVIDVWRRLVVEPSRFACVSTEQLFGSFPIEAYPKLGSWWRYITTRYPWVLEME